MTLYDYVRYHIERQYRPRSNIKQANDDRINEMSDVKLLQWISDYLDRSE
jgi:hypothetical protein